MVHDCRIPDILAKYCDMVVKGFTFGHISELPQDRVDDTRFGVPNASII